MKTPRQQLSRDVWCLHSWLRCRLWYSKATVCKACCPRKFSPSTELRNLAGLRQQGPSLQLSGTTSSTPSPGARQKRRGTESRPVTNAGDAVSQRATRENTKAGTAGRRRLPRTSLGGLTEARQHHRASGHGPGFRRQTAGWFPLAGLASSTSRLGVAEVLVSTSVATGA